MSENPWYSSSPRPINQLGGASFLEYEKDAELEALLDNKRIAFVGPAPHLHGTNSAEIIDGYDLIVRPGQMTFLSENLQMDLGHRTDIVVHSFNHLEAAKSLENIDFFKTLKFVVAAMVATDYAREQNIFFDKLRGQGINVHKPDDRYLFKVFNDVGTTCNVGFMGMKLLLNYNIKELYVAGVSFYNMGNFGQIYNDDYYNTVTEAGLFGYNSNKIVTPNQARVDLHSQMPQIKEFRKMVETDKRIVLDNYLTENLWKE